MKAVYGPLDMNGINFPLWESGYRWIASKRKICQSKSPGGNPGTLTQNSGVGQTVKEIASFDATKFFSDSQEDTVFL